MKILLEMYWQRFTSFRNLGFFDTRRIRARAMCIMAMFVRLSVTIAQCVKTVKY